MFNTGFTIPRPYFLLQNIGKGHDLKNHLFCIFGKKLIILMKYVKLWDGVSINDVTRMITIPVAQSFSRREVPAGVEKIL